MKGEVTFPRIDHEFDLIIIQPDIFPIHWTKKYKKKNKTPRMGDGK